MKETKYGIISDIHGNPNVVIPTIDILKTKGVDRLLVNGDIGHLDGDLRESVENWGLRRSVDYTSYILARLGESGIETYVQPGSHEPVAVYDQVMDFFEDKFSNIFNAVSIPFIDGEDHRIVFLPGSDFVSGGEYIIGDNRLSSGRYVNAGENGSQLVRCAGWKQHLQAIAEHGKGFYYSNMNDLRSSVKEPEKTIVICHIPRKFDNLVTCVDMAVFGEATKDFILNDNPVEKGLIFPIETARKVASAGAPVSLKQENRGNEELRKLYNEIGIRKAVSGHFHESSHRANNSNGEHVKQGEYVDGLFWNSGCLDFGHCGILSVRDGKVRYENIDLRDFLKN